jgi:hypothetical protein
MNEVCLPLIVGFLFGSALFGHLWWVSRRKLIEAEDILSGVQKNMGEVLDWEK